MKAFENITKTIGENAIRLGSSAPNGSVALTRFENRPLNPSNSLSVLDISGNINENLINSAIQDEAILATSDELGFLKTLDGSYTFPSEDITISNIMLNEPMSTQKYEISDLNPNDFAHYYYLSRYFVLAPPNFTFINLNQYLSPEKITGLSVKVVDSNGVEYVDPVSNRRKYRILLEPYFGEDTERKDLYPHRIIVLMDASKPSGCRLVYDKVECDNSGNFFNSELKYSEVINAIPIFSNKAEEAYVLDRNYVDQNNFSIKKINNKHSELVSGSPIESGYQVIAPKKAMMDNRTYEVFNWRLIARTKVSLNFDEVNYGLDLASDGSIKTKTVKAGVVSRSYSTSYSSLSKVNPYVFHRLENSPFNLSKLSFVGANSSYSKDSARHWMTTISDISKLDRLDQYDVLYMNLYWTLSRSETQTLQRFLENNGILIMDIQRGGSAQLLNKYLGYPNFFAYVSGQDLELDLDSPVIDENKNGGWNIDSSIFNDSKYNVNGTNYINRTSSYKNFVPLSASLESHAFLKSGSFPVGVALTTKSLGDRLSSGAIVATTFSLGYQCNNFVSIADTDRVDLAYSSTLVLDESNNSVFSDSQEGPFKLLYNIVSRAMYLRAHANRQEEVRGTLYNFVSDWKSSWAMSSNALFNDEKEKYFVNISSGSESEKYARQLTPVGRNVFEFYKSELKKLSNLSNQKLSGITEDDVEFYIEVTNPDIWISDSYLVNSLPSYRGELSRPFASTTDIDRGENIPSAYNLFKLNKKNIPIYAHVKDTAARSPELKVSDFFGPYAISEKSISSSNSRVLKDSINSLSSFKSYKFDLDTVYSISVGGEETISDMTAKLDLVGDLYLVGEKYYPRRVVQEGSSEFVEGDPVTTTDTRSVDCININSAVEDLGLLVARKSNEACNVFPYTKDLDRGNSYGIVGRNFTRYSDYTTYIQYTLWAYKNYYEGIGQDRNYYPSSRLDRDFGPLTEAGVKKFQEAEGLIYVDGIVDSETKWHLAKFWKFYRSLFPNDSSFQVIYDFIVGYKNDKYRPGVNNRSHGVNGAKVAEYIQSAISTVRANQINTGETYRKLTFTGTRNPSEANDVLFFEIPEQEISDDIQDEYGLASRRVTLESIEIEVGDDFNDMSISEIGVSNAPMDQIDKARTVKAIGKSPSNKKIIIDFPSVRYDDARYMWIKIVGNKLGPKQPDDKYGYGEGYSIKKLKANLSVTTTTYPDAGNVTIDPIIIDASWKETAVKVRVNITDELFSGITPYNYVSKTYDPKNLISPTTYSGVISKIEFMQPNSRTKVEKTYSPNLSLSEITSTGYLYQDGDYRVELRASATSASIASHTVTEVTDANGNVEYNSEDGGSLPLLVSKSGPTTTDSSITISMSTDATYYDQTSVTTVSKTMDEYYLMSVNTREIQDQRNVVDVNDGVVLLTDSEGNPIGFPSRDDITTAVSGRNITTEDVRFGNIIVRSVLPPENGLIFGLFQMSDDPTQREFLGTQISYIEYLSRGPQNIYAAVCAFDADGNTSNANEFISLGTSSTFLPVNLPQKLIAPIYSVKINSKSSISVGSIDPLLSKNEVWELPVKNGSFTRVVDIPAGDSSDEIVLYYGGQKLYCVYSTDDTYSYSSEIYGKNYQDIFSEKPVLVDNKKIRVRKTPILNWNHPTDYTRSNLGIMKPVVTVYTRESVNSDWSEVPYSGIRSINCETGEIDFEQGIVPSDNKLIKVDYVTPRRDIYLRQVDGHPIPLNPFLNNEQIQFDKSLYVYILPKAVYKTESLYYTIKESRKYVRVREYENSNVVNYTYDNSIFDKGSSNYNPLALPIAIINVVRNPKESIPVIADVRSRGGGVKQGDYRSDSGTGDYTSAWDVYPPSGAAYPKGGYVIVKIPRSVEDYFPSKDQVTRIVGSNLTAGVAFEIQDMEGNPW